MPVKLARERSSEELQLNFELVSWLCASFARALAEGRHRAHWGDRGRRVRVCDHAFSTFGHSLIPR
jgi:hypothetical protein